MKQDRYLNISETKAKYSFPRSEGVKMDFVLLRYMAQRIYVTLYLLDEPVNPALPLLYSLEEGHKNTHRMAIYRPQ